MNCKKCGASLEVQTPFCPYCGFPTAEENETPVIPTEQPQAPVEPKQKYKAYIPQNRIKIIFKIALSSISLLLVLLLLFLPIYTWKLPADRTGYQLFCNLPEAKQQKIVKILLQNSASNLGSSNSKNSSYNDLYNSLSNYLGVNEYVQEEHGRQVLVRGCLVAYNRLTEATVDDCLGEDGKYRQEFQQPEVGRVEEPRQYHRKDEIEQSSPYCPY